MGSVGDYTGSYGASTLDTPLLGAEAPRVAWVIVLRRKPAEGDTGRDRYPQGRNGSFLSRAAQSTFASHHAARS